jgi:hypothetical protein
MAVRLQEWDANELREIVHREREWARVRRRILDGDVMLLGKEHARSAEAERVFAAAIAEDLGQPVDALRRRLAAAAAIGVHLAIIRHGYEHMDEDAADDSPYARYANATAFLRGGFDALVRLPHRRSDVPTRERYLTHKPTDVAQIASGHLSPNMRCAEARSRSIR